MKISELQSLIANLRSQINDMHNSVDSLYDDVEFCTNYNLPDEHYRKPIREYKAKIAKYVILQKALKADIAEMIRTERVLRSMDKYNLMRFKEFGKL